MYSQTHQPPLQLLAPLKLLVDGCISTMFGPRDAEAYRSTLLRREAGPLQEYDAPGYPRTFFAVPSPGPLAGPAHSGYGPLDSHTSSSAHLSFFSK